ncbi:MAG: hypothetical protein C4293_08990 [Nitrospiraceae bacterium]
MKQIGIFTATRWEFNVIRRIIPADPQSHLDGYRAFIGGQGACRVVVIQTGVGPNKALAVSRDVLRTLPVDLVVSSGFACALTASSIGDLLIGTDVIMDQSPDSLQRGMMGLACAQGPSAAAVRAARDAGIAARTGRFVTVPRVLWRAEEKREIAGRTGAIGLDMESAAVGAVAAERKIPFVIFRAVSDLLNEDLPLDFNLFLRPSGWAKGMIRLARPSKLIELKRFRAQTALASERMSTFFERFLNDLA